MLISDIHDHILLLFCLNFWPSPTPPVIDPAPDTPRGWLAQLVAFERLDAADLVSITLAQDKGSQHQYSSQNGVNRNGFL